MKVVRDTPSAWPLGNAGYLPVMGTYPWNSVASAHLRWRAPRAEHQPHENPRTTPRWLCGNDDTVLPLKLYPGVKSPHRVRTYICACSAKWTFRVNDHAGSIISIDQTGGPLAEPENSRRAATFSIGPCPVFKDPLDRKRTIEIPPLGWFARTKHSLMRRVSAMWRRWSGERAREIPIDPTATTTIMADDLLG